MNGDSSSFDALFAGLAEIPARLAALERQIAAMQAKIDRLVDALPPLLVSTSEASRVFHVSVPTIRRWLRKGLLPVLTIEGTVRVDLSRMQGSDHDEIVKRARETVEDRKALRGRRKT